MLSLTLSHRLLQAFSAAKASMRKMPTGPDGLSETFFAAPSDPHHQAALLQSVFQQIKQGTLVRGE